MMSPLCHNFSLGCDRIDGFWLTPFSLSLVKIDGVVWVYVVVLVDGLQMPDLSL